MTIALPLKFAPINRNIGRNDMTTHYHPRTVTLGVIAFCLGAWGCLIELIRMVL